MPSSTSTKLRQAFALLGVAFLAFSCANARAGVQATADKEVAQQQVAADNALPFHFSISAGADSEFVFRGVDILPEVKINVPKGFTEAINQVPEFRALLDSAGVSPQAFVAGIGLPRAPIRVSRESGLYYFDGNVSTKVFGLDLQVGAFFGHQIEGRVGDNYFGANSAFDLYREFDAYLSLSRAFGPIRVSLGGTYYHVVNNSDFDTAELNFGVTYTPPKFQYVSASFSYNYAGAFNFSDYSFAGVKGEYLDGHYLEARIDGNVPVYKHVVTFNPYVLVSAGSGILPRAFNPTNLPTYYNTERYGRALTAYVSSVYNEVVLGTPAPSAASIAAARASFDPTELDRSFDLSNFQAGFRVPFYLTRHITIRGDFNYSRPLGNLDREPYNQKDQLWGGGTVTITF